MAGRVYLYAKTGRGGLGNKLFPWARAVVFSQQVESKIISPQWRNLIKIGPYLRKERDKRHYLFIFNNNNYIKGLKKLLILIIKTKVNERYIDKNRINSYKNKIIEFNGFVGEGIKPYFESLLPYQRLISNELKKITIRRLIPDKPVFDFIGVHIRLGDFMTAGNIEALKNADALNFRIPLYWYVNAIDKLRSQLKRDIKVLVFSDGKRFELNEILLKDNVELVTGNKALTDMFYLSYAKVVIASGSTFSMWSVFLGQMPSIWFPGLTRGSLMSEHLKANFQITWEGGDLPEYFISAIGD